MNVLETRFVFDDKDGIKIDYVRNKLTQANDSINNFGKGSLIGKNLADAIKPAESAFDSLNKKVNDSTFKPTISRYWEAEENKTIGSLKAIENAVTKTNNSISSLSPPSLKNDEFVKTLQPEVKFKIDDKSFIDLDKLQKKADDTRKTFADISAQRINSGQIGNLTKELVSAHERSKQLAGDIRNIKTELASPNRKSSIRFLTDELIAAEREADSLNRKLNSLPAGVGSARNGNNSLKLSSFQKQNLSYQINDVLTGLASGQNVTQIAAQQSGQIAQIFSPAQASALVAAYAPLVGILGAGAAALALTYKITGDIRAEAEKRLKIEENLSKEYTKQQKEIKNARRDFETDRRLQTYEQNFSSAVKDDSVEDLKKRRANLLKLVDINPDPNGSDAFISAFKNQIKAIDAQINSAYETRRIAREKELMSYQNFINSQKQINAIEIENNLNFGKALAASRSGGVALIRQTTLLETEALKKQIEINNQFALSAKRNLSPEDLKEGKDLDIAFKNAADNARIQGQINTLQLTSQKQIADELKNNERRVIDLGKAYKSVFNELSAKVNSDNPFVVIFAESRSELDKLKDSLRGLPEEMQRAAIASQQAINRNKLFEARIDNNLSAFDLRETANRFRNPPADSLVDKQRFEEIVKSDIRRGLFSNGSFGTYGSSLAIGAGADYEKLTDGQKRDIYEINQLKNLRNPNANFNSLFSSDVNDRSLISRLARERVANPNENLSLNERLQKQLSIINSGVSTDGERGIADRRLIGLTSGLDPAQIRADLREQIAAANEREAVRKEKYESELLRVQKDELEVSRRIADVQEKLLKIAEKQGLEGLNNLLQIQLLDKTDNGIELLGASGTQADVRRTYFDE